MIRRGFTLIEVAIAGSLIGVCVLSALSIIPRGLKTQNEGRMRAVAAATIMYLSSQSTLGAGKSAADPSSMAAATLPSGVTVSNMAYDSNGAASAPTSLFSVDPLPPVGDLARRLVFSVDQGTNGQSQNTRAITAWLLSADPQDGKPPMRATYMGTFSEYRP